MIPKKSIFVLVAGLVLLLNGPGITRAAEASADHPFLHPLFCDHLVLQREAKVPVWGWTSPGVKVTVKFGGQTKSTVAGADGKWEVRLAPMRASAKPQKLTVASSAIEKTIEVADVLVGDVWLCSGQSNMEMGVGACEVPQDIAAADFPQIRLLTVPRLIASTPTRTLACRWLPCSPTTILQGQWAGFSAAGFFFGRELYRELKIPIGLIHSSWGGTPAEAWTSAEGLTPTGDSVPLAKLPAPSALADPKNPNVATVLYNGMIAPLLPFAIKGAIWYQGESNAGQAYQYRLLLPTMIGDWRQHFGVGQFPFYIVQLAAFQAVSPQPRESNWAELREAQAMTAQNCPNTGLAMALDIGDAVDIHPKNKAEVGRRLALCALAKTYGKKVEFSGPWFKSMKVGGSTIQLSFDHVDGGLVAKGGELKGFAIAGEDKKFVWANARIEGKRIVVASPDVPKPVAVRYAWDSNPVCNLYNQSGLPAVPFRTDNWPGVTQNAK